MKKLLIPTLIIALFVSSALAATPAFAKNDNNNGRGNGKQDEKRAGVQTQIVVSPQLKIAKNEKSEKNEKNDDRDENRGRGHLIAVVATSTATSTTPCVKIPPGHFIAFGWLRKLFNITPKPGVVPCQELPKGIQKKLDGDWNRNNNHGTSTGSTGTTTATTTPPTDTTAPVISNVTVASTTASTSQVSWTTNELATTKLFYSTLSPVPSTLATTTIVMVSGSSTAHSVDLSGLTASTTYYFVAVSADQTGNTSTSTQGSLTTLGL